jgi:hypothetical protein
MLEALISLLFTIVGTVASHYIIKWLDSKFKNDN